MPDLTTQATVSGTGRTAMDVAAWPAPDLEARLLRALDLAAQTVDEFGETGYADVKVPELSFGPEKVVAEATMLAYAASGASASVALHDRVQALTLQLAPVVRSSRALGDMALHPARAFKYAVPHVLLTALGHPDGAFDDFAYARCVRALECATDLPPSAHFERRWMTGLWDRDWPAAPGDPAAGTFAGLPVDVLNESRDDAYALTHILFYLSDFGRSPGTDLSRPGDAVLRDIEALLVRYMDLEDYDLSGELLMAWPQNRAAWDPVAAFCFRVLAAIEDEVGVLPCGNVDLDRLASLEPVERARYARATAYHTAFVMGFLCAVALRHDPRPPLVAAGPEYPDAAWAAFLDRIESDRGHWLPTFLACGAAEKRSLTPMLCHFATAQALRRHDYRGLHDVLLLARRFGIPAHPLETGAADVLDALGRAMSVG